MPISRVHRVAHTTDPDAALANFASNQVALVMRLSGNGCNALALNYGDACTGSNGSQPRHLTAGLPRLGNPDFAFQLDRAPNSTPCALLLGTSQGLFALDTIGAPSCTLHVVPNIGALNAGTDSNGEASIPLAISNDPTFNGLSLFSTWIVLDPGANALGLTTSGGVELVLCGADR